MTKTRAIIIGSGVAGLATSIRFANKGYQVTVIEANNYPGGKLTSFKQGGYRFDAGPSLFTMPHLVDELFILSRKNPREYFNYIRKEESCRYFWDDGTTLTAWADLHKFAVEVFEKLGVPQDAVLKHFKKSRKMYELAGRTFMEKPLNRWTTWLTKDVGRSLLNLHQLSLFSTMHEANKTALQNPKLVQLFDRYATYNGSDPYRAPGMLNIIPHLEHGIGTFIPAKGIYQITQSLVQLAISVGVEFSFNERVEEILIGNEQVKGVRTSTKTSGADVVVSNMDITPTYRKLLPNLKAPERVLRQERSSSALIFYWGIKRTFSELGLHNIFFSNDYPNEFREIFSGKGPAEDPTVYIAITSKDVPEDAPPGCENWFVMINAPRDTGQDWEALIPGYRQAIIRKINGILKTDIEKYIENESILSPPDIERKTSSLGGSLYGNSSNNKFAAFLRHTNESSDISGLYFCGGSVHPGGGIPLCLLSAKILSEICQTPSSAL
ncbi:MAG: 1-hydroxycarotenoid 3,4-desaturase CrtD [Bacteroidales bacterium]